MKAIVKYIEYEGDKPHKITIEAEDGRHISSIIGPESYEVEIAKLMKKLNESVVGQETIKPIQTGDTIELNEKTGQIIISKPVLTPELIEEIGEIIP